MTLYKFLFGLTLSQLAGCALYRDASVVTLEDRFLVHFQRIHRCARLFEEVDVEETQDLCDTGAQSQTRRDRTCGLSLSFAS